jgi:hypothetical protein
MAVRTNNGDAKGGPRSRVCAQTKTKSPPFDRQQMLTPQILLPPTNFDPQNSLTSKNDD